MLLQGAKGGATGVLKADTLSGLGFKRFRVEFLVGFRIFADSFRLGPHFTSSINGAPPCCFIRLSGVLSFVPAVHLKKSSPFM